MHHLLNSLCFSWSFVCEVSLNLPQFTASLRTERKEKYEAWTGPYGRIRFHRETLSLSRWFGPLSHDRDLGCHWAGKKPLCVCLPRCGCCCLFASDCQSVSRVWSRGISGGSPLTLPHPFITHRSIDLSPSSLHPSFHLSLHVSPNGLQMFVSSLSRERLSPSLPPSLPPPSTPPCAGRHRNGWFRKGGRVSQSSRCSAPCSAFTVHICFCAAFTAPDLLTVQVARSDVTQSHQLLKGLFLFAGLKGHVCYLELHYHSCSPNTGKLFMAVRWSLRSSLL